MLCKYCSMYTPELKTMSWLLCKIYAALVYSVSRDWQKKSQFDSSYATR